MTVREFAVRWATDYPRQKESTRQRQAENAAAMVKGMDPWCECNLTRITRSIARAAISRDPWLYPHYRAMFADAEREGLIDSNPFSNHRVPRGGRQNILPLSGAEVVNLARCAGLLAPQTGIEGMILAAAYTGMRQGELWGLCHEAVDHHAQRIHVAARVYRGKVSTPKSGPRHILLHEAAAYAIGTGQGLVFEKPTGGYWTPGAFAYYWTPIRKRFASDCLATRRQADLAMARGGKADLDFHELRHYYASNMLNSGARPEDIAIQLGHQDGGRLVRSLYGHRDEAKALDALREFDKTPEHPHNWEPPVEVTETRVLTKEDFDRAVEAIYRG
jgi:integrase